MLYTLHRRKLRTSFIGEVAGETMLVRSGMFSYWKLKYKDYRCNRYFLRNRITNNYGKAITLRTKRKKEYFHPYEFVWTSAGDIITATNDAGIGLVQYKLTGKTSKGDILATENKIELVINGEFDEELIFPILGEFVFWHMDARDRENI